MIRNAHLILGWLEFNDTGSRVNVFSLSSPCDLWYTNRTLNHQKYSSRILQGAVKDTLHIACEQQRSSQRMTSAVFRSVIFCTSPGIETRSPFEATIRNSFKHQKKNIVLVHYAHYLELPLVLRSLIRPKIVIMYDPPRRDSHTLEILFVAEN